jgi:hypothetical protein
MRSTANRRGSGSVAASPRSLTCLTPRVSREKAKANKIQDITRRILRMIAGARMSTSLPSGVVFGGKTASTRHRRTMSTNHPAMLRAMPKDSYTLGEIPSSGDRIACTCRTVQLGCMSHMDSTYGVIDGPRPNGNADTHRKNNTYVHRCTSCMGR